MNSPFPATLCQPITPDRPGGEDLSFDPELDEIRAARRGDDPALAQGEWVRELRLPQWGLVRSRCERILAERSKDLQVACFYAEALACTGGFAGLAFGLRTLDGLLDRFWAACHPGLDSAGGQGQALEERAGHIGWLNRNVTAAVWRIPLTTPESGGYDWLRWEEARRVDRLALRSPQEKEAAVQEGRICGETFQAAVAASGAGHCQRLAEQARDAAAACGALRATLDRRFPSDPPSVEDLAGAIQACRELAEQNLGRLAPAPGPAPALPQPDLPQPVLLPPASRQLAGGVPPERTRAGAVQDLRSLAAYFRAQEPHSPVAPLVERAAQWAEMPLERWLGAVIKDPGTLAQLRELLGVDL